MDDYISRDDAIKDAESWVAVDEHEKRLQNDVIEWLKELPSAQPNTGKWISADAFFGGVPFYCSECGENTRDTVMGKPRWKFCPNCGAKMEVADDE